MPIQKRSETTGFTIVELIIATSVFSVILLMCASALIQVGRIYQKGVIGVQTQEVTRSVIASLAEAIQFSGDDIRTIPSNNGSNGFCVDSKQYSYRLDRKLVDTAPNTDQTRHALVVDSVSGCGATTAQNLANVNVNGNELLSPNMRLLQVLICIPGPVDATCPNRPPDGSNLYQVSVTVAYGDGDLLSAGKCNSIAIGGSFCAVSSLSTTVQKRIVN